MACSPDLGIVQTIFLGASLREFSASIGWNGQQSTLTVQVAEDDCYDPPNEFSPETYRYENPVDGTPVENSPLTNYGGIEGLIGTPQYFTFGNFNFGGILQTWKRSESVSGKPVYEATIVSPEEVLSNVNVVLGGYNATSYGISNLLNVYGFWENYPGIGSNAVIIDSVPFFRGFGKSLKNDSGLPWILVRAGIKQLQANLDAKIDGVNNEGKIIFRRHLYIVDLDGLPNFPPASSSSISERLSYRIGGNSATLLDIISQVCQDAGLDWFCELEAYTGPSINIAGVDGASFIRIRTASKVEQPQLNKIAEFIDSVTTVGSRSRGLELANDITTMFLVGARENPLYLQAYDTDLDDGDETLDNTIWPYWGINPTTNLPILGSGLLPNLEKTYIDKVASGELDFQNHRFEVDLQAQPWATALFSEYTPSSGLDDIDNSTSYPVDCVELLAALHSKETWQEYIESTKPNYAEALQGLPKKSTVELTAAVLNNTLGIKINPQDFMVRGKKDVVAFYEDLEIRQNAFYEFIKQYATELYGKQFMVKLPFVSYATEPETDRIVTSYSLADAGYVEEGANTIGLTTFNEDKWRTSDNKLPAIARLNKITTNTNYKDHLAASGSIIDEEDKLRLVDISNVSKDDYILQGTTLFLRCSVDTNIIGNNDFGPRGVVSLPSQIYRVMNDTTDALTVLIVAYYTGHQLTADQKAAVEEWAQKVGASRIPISFRSSLHPDPIRPDYVLMPLRSNVSSYGPWVTTPAGPAGKLNFEVDDGLAPWEFGGYSLLNLAGQARVQSARTARQVVERGFIEVPGAPAFSLGDNLVAGGPNITDISVQAGINGVTTSINMKSYIQVFGELARYQQDKIRQLGLKALQDRRTARAIFSAATQRNNYLSLRDEKIATKFLDNLDLQSTQRTPHNILMGYQQDAIDPDGTNRTQVSTFTADEATRAFPWGDDDIFHRTGLMSFDGFFRPFSVDTDHAFLPAYVSPTSGTITVDDLNPFTAGHDIEMVSWGDYTFDGSGDECTGFNVRAGSCSGDYVASKTHALALRGPLVICGWGYDIDGNPTPSGDDGDFVEDYLRKPSEWKVGPVDLRWDEARGVWTGLSSEGLRETGIISGILNTTAVPSGAGSFTAYGSNQVYTAVNIFSVAVPGGTIAQISKNHIMGRFEIVSADCSGVA